MARRFSKHDDTHPDDVRMTLGEHLDELRARLIRSMIALVVGGTVAYLFRQKILAFMAAPLFVVLRHHGISPELYFFDPLEPFMTDIKLALIMGCILTAPYILNQLWGFVAAGLYPHERKWVRRFVPVSITLFFVGAFFFQIVVTPMALNFFVNYKTELPDMNLLFPTSLLPSQEPIQTQEPPLEKWPTSQPAQQIPHFTHDPEDPPEGQLWLNQAEHEVRVHLGDTTYTLNQLKAVGRPRITPTIRFGDYMVFILQMAAAFGLGFQIPVVVALLATIGIFSAADMSRARRYVYFGIAALAVLICPAPDVTSMILLWVPMLLLYEAGLVAARLIEKERVQKPG